MLIRPPGISLYLIIVFIVTMLSMDASYGQRPRRRRTATQPVTQPAPVVQKASPKATQAPGQKIADTKAVEATGYPENAEIERLRRIEQLLTDFGKENPSILERVDISFAGTIQEFCLAFSRETGVNLTVDPFLDQRVVANFADTRPKDILLHLSRTNKLELDRSGSILSLKNYVAPRPPLVDQTYEYTVAYNSASEIIDLEFSDIPLDTALRAIVSETGFSIICTPSVSSKPVSLFARKVPLREAIEMLATRNDLLVFEDELDGYLTLEPNVEISDATLSSTAARPSGRKNDSRLQRSRGSRQKGKNAGNGLDIGVKQDSLLGALLSLNVDGEPLPLEDVLRSSASAAGVNLAILDAIDGEVRNSLDNVTFEQLLETILTGSEFEWRQEGEVYLVGQESNKSMRLTRIREMRYRTLTGVQEAIPTQLLGTTQISPFPELNALVLDGPSGEVERIEAFLESIDRRVPVITIELIIVDVQRNTEIQTGIEAGLGESPAPVGGVTYPEVDFSVSTKSVNTIINLLAGNGIVNLGQVSPNFYLRLQAAESNGVAKIHSKPRLSTVNGHEATFNLGETRYYQIQRTTVQGGVTPISLQDQNFQSVNADFTINILPLVSGNGTVTLDIDVSQSDFIGQLQNDAPPAQVNRAFQSNIRVGDGDMIVLGGLESKSSESSGRGIPFLSRIPVLKFLFSSRRKANSKSKLLIFVRPTVDY